MYLHCPVVREINAEMSDLILDFFKSKPLLTVENPSNCCVLIEKV